VEVASRNFPTSGRRRNEPTALRVSFQSGKSIGEITCRLTVVLTTIDQVKPSSSLDFLIQVKSRLDLDLI
jgi:hypothetical protein